MNEEMPDEMVAIQEVANVLAGVWDRARANRTHGLVRWFMEFDHHARAEQIVVCEALLDEIQGGGYGLKANERPFVDSRRGALVLVKGVAAHRGGRLDEAEALYREALAIQQKADCRPASTQATLMLDYVDRERRTGNRPGLLADISQGLQALGGSGVPELLLTTRLRSSDSDEVREALLACLEERLPGPVGSALASRDVHTRMMATALLGRFEASDALSSAWEGLREHIDADTAAPASEGNWFVRWRAAEAIAQREDALPALHAALAHETDPEVLRTLALALGQRGDGQSAASLLRLLEDSDPDVRYAAVEALERCGDDAAIDALKRVRPGMDIHERQIEEAADQAMTAIRARTPLPSAPLIAHADTLRRTAVGRMVKSKGFTERNPVVVAFGLLSVTESTSVRVSVRDEMGAVVLERQLLASGLSAPDLGTEEDRPYPVEGDRVRLTTTDVDTGTSLRSGDLGTARRIDDDDFAGVEWDRLIDGHDLGGQCPPGRAWWVPRSRLESPYRCVIELVPPGGAWAAGSYAVALGVAPETIGPEGESPQAEIVALDVHVVAQPSIARVEWRAAGEGRAGPQVAATGFLAGSVKVTCVAELHDAPSEWEVRARVFGDGPEPLADRTSSTTLDSPNTVSFAWDPSGWRPGICRLRVTTGTVESDTPFRIVEGVEVLSVEPHANAQRFRSSREGRSIFASSVTSIACAVELSQAKVARPIVWTCQRAIPSGYVVVPMTSDTVVSNELGWLTIVLERPAEGWATGNHLVWVAAVPPNWMPDDPLPNDVAWVSTAFEIQGQ